MKRLWATLSALLFSSLGFSADLARVDPEGARVIERGDQLHIDLKLTRAVPFQITHLQAPPRIAIDFQLSDLSDTDVTKLLESKHVTDGSAGLVGPNASRLLLQFSQPFVLDRAATSDHGGAFQLSLELRPARDAELAARVTTSTLRSQPVLPSSDLTRQDGTRPLKVMLDPGHGGIDPGAIANGLQEAALMLTFAKELQARLQATGMEVLLTRDGDYFVSLEQRVAVAQAARADLMISLHADAAGDHAASGAKAYTISDEASDRLSKLLIQRQRRAAMLAGVDLTAHDDGVADVLTDLARQNNLPRSRALADALVNGLRQHIDHLHPSPRSEANFSVLKAAEVPSVLLELGFVSNVEDSMRLADPVWRAQAQAGIAEALQTWAKADAEITQHLRR